MSAYLISASEAAIFGVATATPAQIQQASALIDTYLSRPEGLVFGVDYAGQPCDMAGLHPSVTYTLTGSVTPGANVVLPVSAPSLGVGDVIVLDRATPASKEATTVVSNTGGQLIVNALACSHSAGATIDVGIVLSEQRHLPENRPITMVSRAPVLRVLSGVGRYGYGRRGDAGNYNMEQFNLLAALSKFGGPPTWEIFNPANTGIDRDTGQVWVPAGIMLAYYSEVRIAYVAGYPLNGIPTQIKQACAEIITALAGSPIAGNLKMARAGDTAFERFTSSSINDDIKEMLAPFRARLFV